MSVCHLSPVVLPLLPTNASAYSSSVTGPKTTSPQLVLKDQCGASTDANSTDVSGYFAEKNKPRILQLSSHKYIKIEKVDFLNAYNIL